MSRNLKNLPYHLNLPVTTLATNVSHEDNKFIACWRPFNTVDDTSDGTERPCQPLRLQPCNHVVGSLCLYELCDRDMKRCPYCNSAIEEVSTIPFWQKWLLECDVAPFGPITYIADIGHMIYLRNKNHHKGTEALARFDKQQDRLFKGTLTDEDGEELWSEYTFHGFIELGCMLAYWIILEVLLYLMIKPLLRLILPSWLASSECFVQGVKLWPVNRFFWMMFLWKSYQYLRERGEHPETDSLLNFVLIVTALACAIEQMAILVTAKIVVLMFIAEARLIALVATLVIRLGSRNRRA
jgi:hypothetical protein